MEGSEESPMTRLRRRAKMEPDDESDGDSSDSWHRDEATPRGDSRDMNSDRYNNDETNAGSDEEWDITPPPGSETDQDRSIGERLERLTHGAGPSRRKRNRIESVGARVVQALNNQRVTSTALKGEKTRRAPITSVHGDDDSARTKARSRANKNRPQELSSSQAVGRFREVVVGKRNTTRDPRFEGGGGSSKLNYDIFRKAYGFLGSYQDKEIEELKKSLKKEKNQERSGRLQTLLARLQQERAERSHGDRRQAALRDAKKKEREAVAAGKKPYFLKDSEKKRLSLEQRYDALKEEGKLGKFMEKKRKKNAAKDHRWLPAKRQNRG